uniref:sensor histidine kinase n=1 Tax=Paractinoplanes polyasparticus TaxID=2856853 RepID=UPI001C857A64|nr:HAMP domain-containing sensor histidine kinase [Actinoplanes polyasparticus]
MNLPEVFRSIRFRLTVIYSMVLFAVAAVTLGAIYLAVRQTTEPQPVTAQLAKVYDQNRQLQRVTNVAEIGQIEAAVNYNTLTTLRSYSMIALAVLFVASLAIGWVLSGRALRPVGAITRTTRDIQATDLSRRIRLGGPRDELRDLADTIDSMLDRLDRAFQAQRQLIDDASHELRSPLAIIRTHLDASLNVAEATPEERQRAVVMVDRATTRMSRLVEDLLATARRSAETSLDADVDLSVVAREAGEESFVTDRPLRLRYETTPGLHLIGDADALRRAAGNLLSNAVRLAPAPSTITVATGRSGSWLWLAVADEGPGIAPDDLPRVFDRFWRGADGGAAAGVRRERRTGLGLAIVRQIVESHDGRVAAYSTPGNGSTFVLWLPATGRTEDAPPPHGSPWP